MKQLLVFAFMFFILSCKDEKIEYYPEGSIKKSFTIQDGKLEGEFKQYYRSGNLELKSYFLNGINIDSTIHFKDSKERKIDMIVRYLTDSLRYNLFYNDSEQLRLEGESIGENKRIGKWIFHESGYDSIVEYKIINAKSYANQIWAIDKNKDTIAQKSNYFDVYFFNKDTIKLNNDLKVSIMLVEPYYGYDTDIEVIIPKIDYGFKDDFSNLREIKLDTLKSLKNDGISNEGIPEDVPINHIVEFAIQFEGPGKKNIKGIIAEYYKDNFDTRIERRLFFEKEIVVVP